MESSHKKNIFFFTDTPIYGGAEIQMYLLAKFLDKEKFNVTVICIENESLETWVKKLEVEEIRVIKLQAKSKNDPAQLKQLKKIFKEEKVDLLHIHVWNPASGRFALMASKSQDFPTIITEHDPFKLPFLKNQVKKALIKHVKKIIAVSNANQVLLQNLYPKWKDKITYIHNGIDITWFESQNLSYQEEESHEKKVLCVAELHERKGHKYLLEAMKDVKAKLILVGKGPEEENLKKMAKDMNLNVEFLGFRKDIPHLMKSADVLVLPSKKEAFGLVILEAFVSKLPVIASNVGGIPEIIQNGHDGIIVEPENSKKLTYAINSLLQDKKMQNKFKENAYKKVKEKFDAKIMAKNTEKLYDELS